MPQTSSRKIPRWLYWVGGVLMLLLLIGGGLSLWLNDYLNNKLAKDLKESVYNSSDGLYKLDFRDIDLSISRRRAVATAVRLIPDTAVLARLQQEGKAPPNAFRLGVERLVLSGVGLWPLLLNRRLEIDAIAINQPDITIYRPRQPARRQPPRTPYQMISKVLSAIQIGKIQFDNTTFTYIDRSKGQESVSKVARLFVDLDNFVIDSLSMADTTRVLFASDLTLRVDSLTLPSGNEHYLFRMQQLSYSMKNREITVKNVAFRPRYSKERFSSVLGYSHDRVDMQLSNLRLSGINNTALLQRQGLFADELSIADGRLDVHRDKTVPMPAIKKNKIGRYPHQLIQQLKLPLRIDAVRLKNVDVTYAELDAETRRTGLISFAGTTGVISNLTNDSASLVRNNLCRAAFSSRFMNAARLSITFFFNMAASNGSLTAKGQLGTMDPKRLNPVMKALANGEIREGQIRRFDFDINANDYRSEVKGTLLYEGLKLDIFKVQDDGRLKKRGLLSSIANAVFITDANPMPGRPVRSVSLSRDRNPGDSFFSMLWQTLKLTMLETVKAGSKKDNLKK